MFRAGVIEKMRIVFSPSKRRPGCVLLQSAMGGDVPSEEFQQLFPAETWLIHPTDDMGAYPVDGEHTLERLSEAARVATDLARGVSRG